MSSAATNLSTAVRIELAVQIEVYHCRKDVYRPKYIMDHGTSLETSPLLESQNSSRTPQTISPESTYDAMLKRKLSTCGESTDATALLEQSVLADEDLVASVVDIDPELERAICRKLDWRLLPALSIMYLFNSLDKSNLGNAKTDGIDIDLGFTANQYNLLLSVFYIPYVLFALPLTLLGKRYGVTRILPALMFGFGLMSVISSACQNWAGLMVVRWFLGMFESAFFPLVIYYLTTFYRRGELARRLAVFYAASNVASAFSGLLAFGVFQIRNSILAGWRWLFIIEGTCTVFAAIGAAFFLPRDVSSARFLTKQERALAFIRIQSDSSAVVNERLNIREALKVFRHPISWGWLILEVCLGVPLQSVTLFLPQIVERLGYSTIRTNLYTVAPNVTGAIALLILAFASDRYRLRSAFIAIGFALPVIGFIAYLSITDVTAHLHEAYFACFLMTAGTATPSVLLSTWFSNNIPSEGQRAALTGVGVPLANLMGIVSSNIFREQDKPQYVLGLVVTACFGAVGAIVSVLMGTWMRFDNNQREKRQNTWIFAQVATMALGAGPAHPGFRWFL
ncbi:major facilitator superfamily domain-containing protein [Lipomyces kononenkoae]|uniref:Major facilitator superfamily domain-containing protein n=1 Tax=Lipomyces kononenkoae TaxID=34357 RepID=A0ACC3T3B6_LIPKO